MKKLALFSLAALVAALAFGQVHDGDGSVVHDGVPATFAEQDPIAMNAGFITADDIPAVVETDPVAMSAGFITAEDLPAETDPVAMGAGFITAADLPAESDPVAMNAGFLTTETDPLAMNAGFLRIADVADSTRYYGVPGLIPDDPTNFVWEVVGSVVRVNGFAPGAGGFGVVPYMIDGKPVKMIGDYAFEETMRVVWLPNTITNIGTRAFALCVHMEMPIDVSSVTRMGDGAFYGSANAPSVFPALLTIPHDLVAENSGLYSLYFPEATFAYGHPFQNCGSLKSIVAPKLRRITTGGEGVFLGGTAITNINELLASVEEIGGTLVSIPSITEIRLPKCTNMISFPDDNLGSDPVYIETIYLTSTNQVTVSEYALNTPSLTAVYWGGPPPFLPYPSDACNSPNMTNYVYKNKGWGATFNGRPVVELDYFPIDKEPIRAIESPSGTLYVGSDVDMQGNDLVNVGSIGTELNPVEDVWVSAGTIHLGGVALSESNGSVVVTSTDTNDPPADMLVAGDVSVSGALTVTGHIYESNSRAFAYLTAPSNTTITTGGTFYPVLGVFTNLVLDGFALGTQGGDPAIVYTNGFEGLFEVVTCAGVASSASSSTIGIGLRVSGVDDPTTQMSGFAKTAGEAIGIGSTSVVSLTNGATVQLVITSDGDGDVLTVEKYRTSIKRFR